MSTKKVLLGIAAAAVIAIGYFAVNGFPPVGPGAEGTVGAAKRYQSEQMTSKDVVVEGKEAQSFLQSETFDQLIKSPAARKVLANDQTRAALASPALAAALASPELSAALQSAELQAGPRQPGDARRPAPAPSWPPPSPAPR